MARPSTLTPARLAKIHAMGRRGVLQRDIAQAVGLTAPRISQILAGTGKRAKRGGAAAIQRDRAIRAAVAATPVRDLAEQHHPSRARIYQILAAPHAAAARRPAIRS